MKNLTNYFTEYQKYNHDEVITFKKPSTDDIEQLYKAANKSNLSEFTYIPKPYTRKHAKLWIEKNLNNPSSFLIILNKTNSIIGVISLIDFDTKKKRTEIAYWLSINYRGQGLMKRSIRLLLNVLENKTSISKVYARIFEGNYISIHLLQSLGFKKEGILSKHEYHDDRMKSVIIMGLILNKAI